MTSNNTITNGDSIITNFTEKKPSIDFIIAKSGHIVPVVDQIYLHSVYDPIKEADDYVQTHEEDLKKNPTVLMLGLGFGYHIFQIINNSRYIISRNYI